MRALSEWLTRRIKAWDERRAPRLCANNLHWLRSRLTMEKNESQRRIIERQIELWEKRLAGEIDDATLYPALSEVPLLAADGTPDGPRSACGCYVVVLILVLVLAFEAWAYSRHLERKAKSVETESLGQPSVKPPVMPGR